ncbi:MAG: DUF1653 domain-containing protein [Rickettsiales bacterium]|jgi:hypothetical protein|nr:DUF1653 domain-containing protein [Rickettsiales bacterium]
MIQVGKIYQHYKGNKYKVIALAKHSEDLSDLVVYQALYEGEFPYGQTWVRPVSIWNEMVEINGQKIPRFTEVL